MSNLAAGTHLFCIWRQSYRALVVDTVGLALMADYGKYQQIRLPSIQSPRMALAWVADGWNEMK